ncbi:TRAP transporter small permease [Paracoccus saliphilus]|uniref:TRAP transporter small permease protein n=1 Tax=Paracoccus saliphilus TaxID=405559 RepID=A0AA46A6E9_9RHOB|nr:TRAP transporter small permease [Paracoccus saliphilus]WCR05458.1 TRAP transporter small permease [Paracoccus saliphilus]SIS96964.1 TRAP-type C4-dicarboxylate transport system, small permease component [Paracoccus saliphilus]
MMIADRDGPLDKVLTGIERGLVLLSGLAIGAIMLVVVADVSMRYLFRQPLTWSYDLIGSYLMVGAFFLALSDTMKQHGHIAIDMFLYRLPHRFMHASQGLGYLLATVILLIIALQAGDRLASAWKGGDLIGATVPWPTWPSYLMVVIGAGVITLRCLVRGLQHLLSCWSGRQLADLPQPHEAGPHDEEQSL